MRSIRNLKLGMKVGFIALALCLTASQGKAQGAYTGKFILPFEARLGSAVLPPGGHTISMDFELIRPTNTERSFRISTTGQDLGIALRLAETDMKTNWLRDNRGAGIFATRHIISPYSAARHESAKWWEAKPDKQGVWRFDLTGVFYAR
jgi:hypothetical protein